MDNFNTLISGASMQEDLVSDRLDGIIRGVRTEHGVMADPK